MEDVNTLFFSQDKSRVYTKSKPNKWDIYEDILSIYLNNRQYSFFSGACEKLTKKSCSYKGDYTLPSASPVERNKRSNSHHSESKLVI